MSPSLLAALSLPLLVLVSGCCCCDLGALVPDQASDAIGDAIAQEVTEGIIEGATGVDVDVQGGRYTMSDGDTKATVAEGVAALDPRNPIAPFPVCPVAGGAAVEADGKVQLTFTQGPCAAPHADLVRHFEAQVAPLGQVQRNEMGDGTDKMVALNVTGDGTRIQTATIMVQSDGAGMQTVIVIVEAPLR